VYKQLYTVPTNNAKDKQMTKLQIMRLGVIDAQLNRKRRNTKLTWPHQLQYNLGYVHGQLRNTTGQGVYIHETHSI